MLKKILNYPRLLLEDQKEFELTELLISLESLLGFEITSCFKYIGPPSKFVLHLQDTTLPRASQYLYFREVFCTH